MSCAFFEEVDTIPDDDPNSTSCAECGADLVRAKDGTVCCSQCGLVVGKGYSWMGTPVPNVVKDPEEETEWDGAIDNGEKALEDAHW